MGVNPVNVLENVPVPVPLIVLLLAVVGFCVVLQHIPLAVTLPPPSLVTLPPLVAAVLVIYVTIVVVIIANVAPDHAGILEVVNCKY